MHSPCATSGELSSRRVSSCASRTRWLLGLSSEAAAARSAAARGCRYADTAGPGKPGPRPARRRHAPAPGPRPMHLRVRTQGGRVVLADRGHPVVAVGSAAVRARRRARNPSRRRPRDSQLHRRRAELRPRPDRTARRTTVQRAAAARSACPADAQRPWLPKGSRRVPPPAELARREPAGSCSLRPAARPRGRSCNRRARAAHPRRAAGHADSDQGGARTRPVREHPSLPRRQRVAWAVC